MVRRSSSAVPAHTAQESQLFHRLERPVLGPPEDSVRSSTPENRLSQPLAMRQIQRGIVAAALPVESAQDSSGNTDLVFHQLRRVPSAK